MSGAHPGPGDQRTRGAAAEAMLTKAPELALVFARRALTAADAPGPSNAEPDVTGSGGRRRAPGPDTGRGESPAVEPGGRRRAPEPDFGTGDPGRGEPGGRRRAPEPGYGDAAAGGSGGRRRASDPDFTVGGEQGYGDGSSYGGSGLAGSGGRRRAPDPDFVAGYGDAAGTSFGGSGDAGSGGRRRAPDPDVTVGGGQTYSELVGSAQGGLSFGVAESAAGSGRPGRRRAAEPADGGRGSAADAGRYEATGADRAGVRPISEPLLAAARAVEVSALIKLGRHAEAVAPAISALSGGALTAGAAVRVRTELAACARRSAAPRVALTILRPVLESDQAPSVRADALIQYAGCMASLNRRRGVEGLLAEADRLLAADQRLDADVRRVRRALVCVRTAAHQRYHGDTRSALAAAREGLALLDRLSDPNVDGGLARPRLLGEMIFALLDTGDRKAATDLATALAATPVRATSAMAVGMVMLAIATRVHLPAGRTGEGHAMLTEAVRLARRHEVHSLLAEALTTLAEVEEQQGKLEVALDCLRAARAAETAHRQATEQARTLLTDTFGIGEALPAEPVATIRKPAQPPRATTLPAPRTAEDEQPHPTSGAVPFGQPDAPLGRSPELEQKPSLSQASPEPRHEPRVEDSGRASRGGLSDLQVDPAYGRSASAEAEARGASRHGGSSEQSDELLGGLPSEPRYGRLSAERGVASEPSGLSELQADPQWHGRREGYEPSSGSGEPEAAGAARHGGLSGSDQPEPGGASHRGLSELQADPGYGRSSGSGAPEGRGASRHGGSAEQADALLGGLSSETGYGRSSGSGEAESGAAPRGGLSELQADPQWGGDAAKPSYADLRKSAMDALRALTSESPRWPFEEVAIQPAGTIPEPPEPDDYPTAPDPDEYPTPPEPKEPDRPGKRRKPDNPDVPPAPEWSEGRRHRAEPDPEPLRAGRRRRPEPDDLAGPGNLDMGGTAYGPHLRSEPIAPPSLALPEPPEPPPSLQHRDPPGSVERPDPPVSLGRHGSAADERRDPSASTGRPDPLGAIERRDPPASLGRHGSASIENRDPSDLIERYDPPTSIERREAERREAERREAGTREAGRRDGGPREIGRKETERQEPRSDAGLAELLAEAMVAYQSGQEAEDLGSGRHRNPGEWTADGTHG